MADPITPIQFMDALLPLAEDLRVSITDMVTVVKIMDNMPTKQRLEFLELLEGRYIMRTSRRIIGEGIEEEESDND